MPSAVLPIENAFVPSASVKSNIGHAALAAGMASLLKVLLSLQHRRIPASLHFHQPNEHIDFENSPFYVNTETRDWHALVTEPTAPQCHQWLRHEWYQRAPVG